MDDTPRLVRVGHSPDPDDAFMFHALTTGLIDTPGYNFEHVLLDIETLNEKAMNGEYEVSAVSIHAFPDISDKYTLMNCGASMGEGYGPMLVSSNPMDLDEACSKPIAIPGDKTSAHLALKLACGEVDTVIVPFDEIIPRILSGEFTSGVIIHEGQLTWASHGLNLVLDLGIWWNERTGGLPLPLGGNVVRNDLGDELCNQITAWVKQSIEIAINNPEGALEFARQWGRGIDEETNSKFVQMYVNERTIDYEDEGRSSIVQFLTEGIRIGMIDPNFCPEEIKFIGV
ncbi:MAG TPA: MqnA/MqnD/SBP family protein [Candidatus Thalassarchaeaceae archaeon]|jgi:1,4-dihydroxy-6-naphthoate synthase|nr:MqnA/MqnD/SBP family protein [Candidatus Thalassarchaeaceae archaeon]